VQIETLGAQLNTALARAVSEERRRIALEEAERIRLEEEAARLAEEAARLAEEAQNLERFRSDFFGQLRVILEGQERVRIEGDRFIFNSEVLFDQGSAELSPAGEAEIAGITELLSGIASQIPEGIDWLIRVDGHTDNIPINPGARFADNWELSQARALSVVRFMSEDLGFDPRRLAANGFGEHQPLNPLDTPEARAQNRRIELKLTER
jgi:chemotaxis protein MotB